MNYINNYCMEVKLNSEEFNGPNTGTEQIFMETFDINKNSRLKGFDNPNIFLGE